MVTSIDRLNNTPVEVYAVIEVVDPPSLNDTQWQLQYIAHVGLAGDQTRPIECAETVVGNRSLLITNVVSVFSARVPVIVLSTKI